MTLTPAESELFYKLYHPLLFYTNQKFRIIQSVRSVDVLRQLPVEQLRKVRDRLYDHPGLFLDFAANPPFALTAEELEIVRSWEHFVKGKFFILRYLKKYTVFLDADMPPKAYGVVALHSTFEEMVGPRLPVYVEAVLLPFKGRITYDGFLASYPISFGRGAREMFNDSYRKAKATFGIVASLPFRQ